jgi:hypothetical protein
VLRTLGNAAIVLAIPAALVGGVVMLSNSDAGAKEVAVRGTLAEPEVPHDLQAIRVTVSLYEGAPHVPAETEIPVDQVEHNLSDETGIDQPVTRRFELRAAPDDGPELFAYARVELSDFSGICGGSAVDRSDVRTITVRATERC